MTDTSFNPTEIIEASKKPQQKKEKPFIEKKLADAIYKVQYPGIFPVFNDLESESFKHWIYWDEGNGYKIVNKVDMKNTMVNVLLQMNYKEDKINALLSNALTYLQALSSHEGEKRKWSSWNSCLKAIPIKTRGRSLCVDLDDALFGQIVESSPDVLATRRLNIDEDGLENWSCRDVKESKWFKRFEQAFPDEDDQSTVLQIVGNAFAGNPDQRIVFLEGDGATGKSSFLADIDYMFNEFAMNIHHAYICPRRHEVNMHPTGLVPLQYSLVCMSDDMPKNGELNSDVLKAISGHSVMEVRGMRENFSSIVSSATPMFTANHLPSIPDAEKDGGMARRLIRICCNNIIPVADRKSAMQLERERSDPMEIEAFAFAVMNEMRSSRARLKGDDQRTGVVGRLIELSVNIKADTEAYLQLEDTDQSVFDEILEERPGERVSVKDILTELHKGDSDLKNVSNKGLGKRLLRIFKRDYIKTKNGNYLQGWNLKDAEVQQQSLDEVTPDEQKIINNDPF